MSSPSPLIHLEISFHTTDPRGRKMLAAINDLPDWSPERAEAEWFLYSMLARVAARRADYLRDNERDRKRRQERKNHAKDT